MTIDAYKPDARFLNPDGSIDYKTALAAGRSARSRAIWEIVAANTAATPKSSSRVAAARRAALAMICTLRAAPARQ
jgi:hypothetical protein